MSQGDGHQGWHSSNGSAKADHSLHASRVSDDHGWWNTERVEWDRSRRWERNYSNNDAWNAQQARRSTGSREYTENSWSGSHYGKSDAKDHWRQQQEFAQWARSWEQHDNVDMMATIDDNCDDCDELTDDEELYRSEQQLSFLNLVMTPGGGCRSSGGMNSTDSARGPKVTLLFFHSCAHGPEDVFYYLPHLWCGGLRPSDIRIVAPCSPQRRYSDGWVCNSWYEYVTDRCWQGSPDKVAWEQFLEQRRRMLKTLEEEHNRLPPGGCLVLGGLSQGAAMALDVMLHSPLHINSIVGCFCTRGMMQAESLWDLPPENVRQRSASCPVLVFHGKRDSIVPWQVARKSYKWLANQDFDVTTKTSKWTTHSTECKAECEEIGRFIARLCNAHRDMEL